MNKNKDISKYKSDNTSNDLKSTINESTNINDYSYDNTDTTDTTDNADNIDREDLIDTADFYELRGWISSEKRKELEKCSDTELNERLNKIFENIVIQEEYNDKYREQLSEIFKKEINVELNYSEDAYYKYMPSNTIQPKAQVEYVTINENGISTIYYSIELDLTITDKRQNSVEEISTKKYYKATNIHELDGIIKINNYNTQTNQDEITNAINATIEEPIYTIHSSNLPYYFYNIGKYVLYYLPDENRDML